MSTNWLDTPSPQSFCKPDLNTTLVVGSSLINRSMQLGTSPGRLMQRAHSCTLAQDLHPVLGPTATQASREGSLRVCLGRRTTACRSRTQASAAQQYCPAPCEGNGDVRDTTEGGTRRRRRMRRRKGRQRRRRRRRRQRAGGVRVCGSIVHFRQVLS